MRRQDDRDILTDLGQQIVEAVTLAWVEAGRGLIDNE
jgi:hypothetical protein